MTALTLYQCAADVQAALDYYFDSETEREDTLEAVIGQFEVKAQSVIAYIKNQ
ncbi:TPA: siphovirus Gp157 family protein, partial [Neisseria gonorrhoeae]